MKEIIRLRYTGRNLSPALSAGPAGCYFIPAGAGRLEVKIKIKKDKDKYKDKDTYNIKFIDKDKEI